MARFSVALTVALVLGLAGCGGHDGGGAAQTTSPVAACDTSAVAGAFNGACVEYLVSDTATDRARVECTGSRGGTWVASCPTANRVASCRSTYSIQHWYANYTGSLSDAQELCRIYGTNWTTY